MPKTIAIHQPNYLPWLGYFYKIYASDIFVFHDNVAYSKKSLTKRCQIRKAKGRLEKSYLTIPLKKHRDGTLIKDLCIDHGQAWRQKQLNQIRNTYAKAPFFDQLFPTIEGWIKEVAQMEKLVDGNIYLITQILEWLGIHRPFFRSSELPVNGIKSTYNRNIAAHFGATIYLSGSGARKYQQAEEFDSQGIELKYHDFLKYHQSNSYPQYQGAYIPGLSVLDGLFNVGREGCVSLFSIYERANQII